MIPIWLPWFEQTYWSLPIEQRALALKISPATIDRIFNGFRKKYRKYGLSTTKPGSILKEFIPIKTAPEYSGEESRPGLEEADTVAHCGTTVAGMYANTVNLTDIATGWSIQRAVWGKGEKNVLEAIREVESVLPFAILGLDSDNGNEFLNWHLLRYFKERKNNRVQFSRSRQYHKNDNAHVEEKNWSLVRQYLGYERFDNPECIELIQEFYRNEFYHFVNFFLVSFKLIDKGRIGSKIKKVHDKPKTPYQRLMESEHIDNKTKQKLTSIFRGINPYDLQKRIRRKIKRIQEVATSND